MICLVDFFGVFFFSEREDELHGVLDTKPYASVNSVKRLPGPKEISLGFL